jgi:hypothetical protein
VEGTCTTLISDDTTRLVEWCSWKKDWCINLFSSWCSDTLRTCLVCTHSAIRVFQDIDSRHTVFTVQKKWGWGTQEMVELFTWDINRPLCACHCFCCQAMQYSANNNSGTTVPALFQSHRAFMCMGESLEKSFNRSTRLMGLQYTADYRQAGWSSLMPIRERFWHCLDYFKNGFGNERPKFLNIWRFILELNILYKKSMMGKV